MANTSLCCPVLSPRCTLERRKRTTATTTTTTMIARIESERSAMRAICRRRFLRMSFHELSCHLRPARLRKIHIPVDESLVVFGAIEFRWAEVSRRLPRRFSSARALPVAPYRARRAGRANRKDFVHCRMRIQRTHDRAGNTRYATRRRCVRRDLRCAELLGSVHRDVRKVRPFVLSRCALDDGASNITKWTAATKLALANSDSPGEPECA